MPALPSHLARWCTHGRGSRYDGAGGSKRVGRRSAFRDGPGERATLGVEAEVGVAEMRTRKSLRWSAPRSAGPVVEEGSVRKAPGFHRSMPHHIDIRGRLSAVRV